MYLLFADGGSRNNPGPSSCAFVIYNSKTNFIKNNFSFNIENENDFKKQISDNFEIIEIGGEYLGKQTNNFAEWQGLLLGLKKILSISSNLKNKSQLDIKVFLDSLLVVQQAKGNYKVKNSNLISSYLEFQNIKNNFTILEFYHIRRHLNTLADSKVNEILEKNK